LSCVGCHTVGDSVLLADTRSGVQPIALLTGTALVLPLDVVVLETSFQSPGSALAIDGVEPLVAESALVVGTRGLALQEIHRQTSH